MSVNLLPDQDRKKEEAEIQKNAFANKRPVFEYTQPKMKEIAKHEEKSSFWNDLKQEFKDLRDNFISSKKIGLIQPAKTEQIKLDDLGNTPENKKETEQVKDENKNKPDNFIKDIQANRPAETEETKKNPLAGLEKKIDNLSAYQPKVEKKLFFGKKNFDKQHPRSIKDENFLKLKDFPANNLEINYGPEINLIPEAVKEEEDYKRKKRNYFLTLLAIVLVIALLYSVFSSLVEHKKVQVKRVEDLIDGLSTQISQRQQSNIQVKLFLENMKVVKEILDKHIFTSQAFKFLEDNTLTEVYYSEAQVDTIQGALNLQAYAKDYATLTKQILYFQSLAGVNGVSVSGVSAVKPRSGDSEDEKNLGVSFNMNLGLNEDFFFKIND